MKPKEELLPCLMCGKPSHLFGGNGTPEADYYRIGCDTSGCLFQGGVGPWVKGAPELTRMWNAAAARKQQINETAARIKAARESCERQELKTMLCLFLLWAAERDIWFYRKNIGDQPTRLPSAEAIALYTRFIDEAEEAAG